MVGSCNHWILLVTCLFVAGSPLAVQAIDEDELILLTEKLKPKQCWILGNILAQKSWDPLQASSKMTKVAGHSREFNCLAALDLWNSELLPITIQKFNKNSNFADEILNNGLRFVRRSDLIGSLASMRKSKIEGSGEITTNPPMNVNVENTLDGKEQESRGSGMDLIGYSNSDILGDTNTKINKVPHERNDFGLNLPAGKPITIRPAIPPIKSFETPRNTEKEVDSIALVIKFMVLFLIGLVALCLIVAIIFACLRARDDGVPHVDLEGPIMNFPSSISILSEPKDDTNNSNNGDKQSQLIFPEDVTVSDTNANPSSQRLRDVARTNQ